MSSTSTEQPGGGSADDGGESARLRTEAQALEDQVPPATAGPRTDHDRRLLARAAGLRHQADELASRNGESGTLRERVLAVKGAAPVAPDASGPRAGLVYDLKDTIEERAVLCVTGPGTTDAVRAALTRLGQTPHVEVRPARGITTTGFAHALYTALRLEVPHGPAPAERSATNRRIDAHLARRSPTLVVADADALRRAVLQDLVGRWKDTPGPCPLILTGTHRLPAALAAAALDTLVYLWDRLDA